MVDEFEEDLKRFEEDLKRLKVQVAGYKAITDTTYKALERACRDAMELFQNKMIKLLDDRTRQMMQDRNKSVTTMSFLIDLAISVAVGPILEKITVTTLKKGFDTFLINREKTRIVHEIHKKHSRDPNWKFREATGDQLKELTNYLLGDRKKLSAERIFELVTPLFQDFLLFAMNTVVDQGKTVLKTSPKKINTLYSETESMSNADAIDNLITGISKYFISTESNTTWENFIDNELLLTVNYHPFVKDQLTYYNGLILPYREEDLADINTAIYDQFVQLLEIIIWILYLGDPDKWIKTHNVDLEGNKILLSENVPYKYTVEDYGQYVDPDAGLAVFQFTTEAVGIPKALLDYFLSHFKVNLTESSFLEYYTSKRQEAFKRKTGPGIEYGEPIGYGKLGKRKHYGAYHAASTNPAIDDPMYSARNVAIIKMMNWIKIISTAMKKDENMFVNLLNQKKLLDLSNPVRHFH
jgi:hypothetical protein